MDWSWLGYALAVILMLAGLAGTLYPALPGLLLLGGGMLLAAWLGDFSHVGMWPLIVIGMLVVLGMVVENLAGLLGARKSGASRQALIGAFIGGVVGMFLGLFGAIIGPIVGAVIGELQARRSLPQAGKVGLATLAGFIAGTAVKIACAFAMLAVFAGALLFGGPAAG
ncbi:DUF456 domain-containing protein [Vogesella oryzae]|uniref:DUF456 domain-containing protein n=1 Tax=Vogesella oryzae TaxID=1735285 RepID=UPI0015831F3F|nr:DUF456 domain-containing protein [Vogesella oryzae]